MTATARRHLSAHGAQQLYDTAAHAATTALTVAAALADPVRSQSSRTIYPLIGAAASGDGAQARARCGPLCTLVADVLGAVGDDDPRAKLVLALERWLLHPGRRTAEELVEAAADVVGALWAADPDTMDQAWLVGAGTDAALDAARENRLDHSGAQVSLIAAAAASLVPLVWVARELDVTRAVIYRHTRSADPDRWRELLP